MLIYAAVKTDLIGGLIVLILLHWICVVTSQINQILPSKIGSGNKCIFLSYLNVQRWDWKWHHWLRITFSKHYIAKESKVSFHGDDRNSFTNHRRGDGVDRCYSHKKKWSSLWFHTTSSPFLLGAVNVKAHQRHAVDKARITRFRVVKNKKKHPKKWVKMWLSQHPVWLKGGKWAVCVCASVCMPIQLCSP